MLENQIDQHERRAVMRNEQRVREQTQTGTYLSHTHDDAGGRFAAISNATVVGADPIPNYPAAAAHQHDPCGLEPPIGYRIDAMPDPEEPSTVHHAAVEQTGEPPSASPLSRGSPLSSLGDLTSDGDAPSSQLDVQRAGVGSPPLNRFRRRNLMNAAGQIWPHLPHDEERVAKQSKPTLADSLWPSLSASAKAQEAWQARWQAEEKARVKRMVEHLRQINERLRRERA